MGPRPRSLRRPRPARSLGPACASTGPAGSGSALMCMWHLPRRALRVAPAASVSASPQALRSPPRRAQGVPRDPRSRSLSHEEFIHARRRLHPPFHLRPDRRCPRLLSSPHGEGGRAEARTRARARCPNALGGRLERGAHPVLVVVTHRAARAHPDAAGRGARPPRPRPGRGPRSRGLRRLAPVQPRVRAAPACMG